MVIYPIGLSDSPQQNHALSERTNMHPAKTSVLKFSLLQGIILGILQSRQSRSNMLIKQTLKCGKRTSFRVFAQEQVGRKRIEPYGGSTNGDTPKWSVYKGKSQSKMDDLGLPPFQETSILNRDFFSCGFLQPRS